MKEKVDAVINVICLTLFRLEYIVYVLIMYKYIILLLCLFGCAEIIYTPPTVSYITSITQNGDTVKVIQVKDKYKTTYYVSPCYKNE